MYSIFLIYSILYLQQNYLHYNPNLVTLLRTFHCAIIKYVHCFTNTSLPLGITIQLEAFVKKAKQQI